MKIKILTSTQKHLALLGIIPTQSSQKHPFNLRNVFVYMLFGIGAVFSCIYLIYKADTFIDISTLFYTTSSLFNNAAYFSVFVWKMRKLFELIEKLENLIEERQQQYPPSKPLYVKTNRRVDKVNNFIYSDLLKIIASCYLLPKPISSMFTYYFTNSDNALQLPFPMWFPLDIDHLAGYLLTLLLECVELICILILNTSMVTYAIGFFLFGLSLFNDVKRSLHSINKKANRDGNNQTEIFTELCDFIRFQSSVRQIIGDHADWYQPILFMMLFPASLTSCATFLMIQMELSKNGSELFVLLSPIAEMSIVFGAIFIACDFCERMNNAYEEINYEIEQLDWYLLPPKVQSMLPMIMHNTQQSFRIYVFGSIACNRETFKQIANRLFTYVMFFLSFI